MADDPRSDSEEERYQELQKAVGDGETSPRDLFKQTTNIAVLLAYDMIDKLRFYEKEVLARPEPEVTERLEHLSQVLEDLRTTYLNFTDVDF